MGGGLWVHEACAWNMQRYACRFSVAEAKAGYRSSGEAAKGPVRGAGPWAWDMGRAMGRGQQMLHKGHVMRALGPADVREWQKVLV